MWGWRSPRTIAVSAAGAAFVLFCVLPLAFMVVTSIIHPSARSTLSVWLDSRQRGLLLNTALLGGGTALAATALGVPLGVAFARVTLPFKPGLRILLAAPALIPSSVMGLAWLSLAQSPWMSSLPSAVTVLTVALYPLSMLTAEAAARGVEPRLEESASLVAPPGRVLRRITAPLIGPHVLAAALIVFVLAISDFGVPALLRVPVFTTEIFTAFAALYDPARATTLTIPLLLLTLLITLVSVSLISDRMIVRRRRLAGRHLGLGRWRGPALTLMIGTASIGLGLPMTALLSEVRGVSSWTELLQGSGQAMLNSLTLAAVGATLVSGLALALGYARSRARRSAAVALDALFVALFAVPGTVVGVALIELWNQPTVVGALYGTDAMFVLVYLARFTPLAALILAAGFRRVPPSQEEAAAVSGAGWLATMAVIVVPQLKRDWTVVWIIVFTLAFGELGASVLVTPPGESTLPVRIYTLIANAPRPHVAALALLQATVVLAPLALIALMLGMRREQ